jgi:hypothetical protein
VRWKCFWCSHQSHVTISHTEVLKTSKKVSLTLDKFPISKAIPWCT